MKTTLLFLAPAVLIGSPLNDLGSIEVLAPAKSNQNLTHTTQEVALFHPLSSQADQSLSEALSSQGTFGFSANGGPMQPHTLYLHGSKSRHTLFMLDGVRLSDPTSLNGTPLELIDLQNIDQVEILKGGQSGIWGANAAAGLVMLRSYKAPKGTHIKASYTRGSWGYESKALRISHKNKDFSIWASHLTKSASGFSAQGQKDAPFDSFEKDGYSYQSSQLHLELTPSENHLITMHYSKSQSEVEGDSFMGPNTTYDSQNKFTLAYLTYQYRYENLKLTQRLSRSSFSRYYPQAVYGSPRFDGNRLSYSIDANYHYYKENFFQLGFEYNKEKDQNRLSQNATSKSLYLTHHLELPGAIGGKTLCDQSIRVASHKHFSSKATYALHLRHIHSNIDHFSSYASYATAYNTPTLDEQFNPMYGNKELSPESSKSYRLGLSYYGLKIGYFHNTITNMIDYDFTTWRYANIEKKSHIDGAELDYHSNLTNTLALSLHYERFFTFEDANKQQLARRAKSKATIALDYRPIASLALKTTAKFVGKRYDKANKQGEQTGNYWLFDMSANYKLNRHISIFGELNNIANRRYETVHGYLQPLRNYKLGLSYQF